MVIAGCNGGGDSIGDVMKDCDIHVDDDSGDKVKEDRVAGDECFGVGDDNSGNDLSHVARPIPLFDIGRRGMGLVNCHELSCTRKESEN